MIANDAGVAQLVERLFCKQMVGGSIPLAGSVKNNMDDFRNTSVLIPNRIRDLYWNKEYTLKEIAAELGITFWKVYNLMNKHKIDRRNHSEVTYISNRLKPKFIINSDLGSTGERLKVAGIMLYWAEGTLKRNTVDFANSNPEMIRIFLKFLRNVCGVSEDRLRVYLYAYSCHNLDVLKKYWHNVTKIPLDQFTKPYIRQDNPNLSNRKLPYGLVHIRYNDTKLLETIGNWINDYSKSVLIRAGTQAAKGDRLCKRSVLSKGRMEK